MRIKDFTDTIRHLTDPFNIPEARRMIAENPALTQEQFKAGGIVEPGVTHYAILTEAEKRANVKTWEKNTGLNFEDVENKKKSYNIRSGSMTGAGPGQKIKWTPEKTANYKNWIKLYSLEEYNKLHPDSQHHVREGVAVKAVETRGKNLDNFFTQEISKANAGEKFVSQKEILQKANKKFNLKKINASNYPVLNMLETRADKIDQTLKNMLMEDKPLKNFWQDAILKRTGLNNIILQRTLDSGNVKTYNVLADQGAAFIRQNIPRANWQKGSYDFIKNLSFSDQLSKALEIIEGRPILTGIQTVGGRANAPRFKVMQFAFRSWDQNQGKGPIKFFDKNGKPITWEFGGKKLPIGEITFEYKGKKYNTKNLSDPSLLKSDFPEVYKTQTNIERFARQEIDNPFKPGEKISVRKLIKQIQVDGYKWSPKTGSLAILHGSEGVKNKPFTDLVFNTTDINQVEQVLERKLTSKKITKSQYNETIKDLRGLFKGTTGLDYEQSIIDRLGTQVKEIQKYKGEGKPLIIDTQVKKLLSSQIKNMDGKTLAQYKKFYPKCFEQDVGGNALRCLTKQAEKNSELFTKNSVSIAKATEGTKTSAQMINFLRKAKTLARGTGWLLAGEAIFAPLIALPMWAKGTPKDEIIDMLTWGAFGQDREEKIQEKLSPLGRAYAKTQELNERAQALSDQLTTASEQGYERSRIEHDLRELEKEYEQVASIFTPDPITGDYNQELVNKGAQDVDDVTKYFEDIASGSQKERAAWLAPKTSKVMETIIDKPGKSFIDFTLGPNWKENLPEQQNQFYKKRYPRNPRELGQHLSYDPDIPMFAEGGIASLKK